MDDTTSTSNTSVTATQPAANTVDDSAHRQAYGTAKTENLRDSGLWRILLPGFVLVASVILLAFPLIILTPLFLHSLDPLAAANQLNRPETWIWIVMFLVEVGVIAVIVRGLAKTFLVGDGNYRR
ncbi:MAG TPA: hypothetical protein VGS41_05995 [Chthonomonadales bacterium]|nr:hypothetical protein [Chthonomonadales bacterium]